MTPTSKQTFGAPARADAAEQGTPQSSNAGPFVLNLCSSTTPMALPKAEQPELRRFSFFVSRRFEEGRERFRLHMGFFSTLREAEEWLATVREIYPGAWAGEAPGKKLRERAVAAAAAQAQHAAGPPPRDATRPLKAPEAHQQGGPAPHAALPTVNPAELNVPTLQAATPGAAIVEAVRRAASNRDAASAEKARAESRTGSHTAPPAIRPAARQVGAEAVAPTAPAAVKAAGVSPQGLTVSSTKPAGVGLAKPAQVVSAKPAVVGPARLAGTGSAKPPGVGPSKSVSVGPARPVGVGPAKPAGVGPAKPAAGLPGRAPVVREAPAARAAGAATPAVARAAAAAAHAEAANRNPGVTNRNPVAAGRGTTPAPTQAMPTARPQPSAAKPVTKPVKPVLPDSNVREVLAALSESMEDATGETRLMPALPRTEPTEESSFTDTQVLKFLETRRADGTESHGDEDAAGAISLLKPDDTGTRRALKQAVTDNAEVWFAVQLQWSVQPVELTKVPPLAIFSAYTLYTVEGSRDGRKWYGLRLGFFSDAVSAKQVAYYVRSEFTSVAVVPVSPQEHTRATESDQRSAQRLAVPKKTRPDPVDEFKLIDDSVAQPSARVMTPTRQMTAMPPANANPAPAPAAARPPKGGRVRARERRGPQTLEETLEILGASQLEIDNGTGETLNESGVRHLRVEVQKNTPFSRLLERLSERVRKP